MQAEINIGEYNICVECGKVGITESLDVDGLPICTSCNRRRNLTSAAPDPPAAVASDNNPDKSAGG